MENNKRIVYPDILRILAIFFVVSIHTITEFWTSIPLKSTNWVGLVIINTIAHTAVPLFIMVSGMFMLSPQKEKSIRDLYSKNILRLATAFIFWSMLYTAIPIISNKITDRSFQINFIEILQTFVEGKYHLWFLYMIIGLYIITPILKKIVSDKKIIEYFLIVWFIFCLFFNFSKLIPYIGEPIHKFIDTFKMSIALEYSGFYCLGYYLHNYKISKKAEMLTYVIGVFSILATIFVTVYLSFKVEKPFDSYLDYLLPNTLFSSTALFLAIKRICARKTFSKRQKITITALSKYSFGVYLCHILILRFLSFFILKAENLGIFVQFLILLILTTILSFAVSAVINKIPFLNKYIV